MRQLFGTDGIRGVAGEYPLDRQTVFAIGRALGQRLAARDKNARVLIGQDTRESSAWISSRPGSGPGSHAGATWSAPASSPRRALPISRASTSFSAGIVISASHNPWQDNGIKIFGADGYKLSDELEHEIEADIFAHMEQLAEGASHAVGPASEMLPGDQQSA